jgi:DNA-binding XRE family transcriptional regulator
MASSVLRHAPQSSEMSHTLFGRPSGRSYRRAVADIIRNVKASKKIRAEDIGCSETTVYNAENENGDLSAVTLLSIAFKYGEDAIAPVRELYLCAAPEKPTRQERFRRLHAEIDALEREDPSA